MTRSGQCAGLGIDLTDAKPGGQVSAPNVKSQVVLHVAERVTDWTAEMPITSNVAWDGRLEAFKGRDTAQYIETVKATASRCAACRLPLGPGAALSLMVFITESRGLEGIVSSVSFDSAICHLQCQEPGLSVREGIGVVESVTSVGARLVLGGCGPGKPDIPVLAYTLVPNVVIGEPGGEMTSALVSLMLNHGFQMSFSANYSDILQQAIPAGNTCTCTVADGGAVQLHVDGLLMCSQQLDRTNRNDAAWLQATDAGSVLVISGDNLAFTDTDLELAAAARLGTLVTGVVAASW
jgi:hypothetical protein